MHASAASPEYWPDVKMDYDKENQMNGCKLTIQILH